MFNTDGNLVFHKFLNGVLYGLRLVCKMRFRNANTINFKVNNLIVIQ